MTGKVQKGSGFASAVDPLARHRPAATPNILEHRGCQRSASGALSTQGFENGDMITQDSHQSQAK